MSTANITKEWLRAKDAFQLVSEKLGPSDAARSIAMHLHSGRVKARARGGGPIAGLDIDAERESIPLLEGKKTTKIKPSIWRSSTQFQEDSSTWRWQVSFLHVTTRSGLIGFRFVSLRVQDLKSAFPQVFGSTTSRKRGPKEDTDRRDNIWLVVLEWALKGQLTKGEFKNQEALKNDIYEELSRRHPKPADSKNELHGLGNCKGVAAKAWGLLSKLEDSPT